jgi:hypothetical protein
LSPEEETARVGASIFHQRYLLNHRMQHEQRIYPIKVDALGGITLPLEIRERQHITGGDTLILVDDAHGLHLSKLEAGASGHPGDPTL